MTRVFLIEAEVISANESLALDRMRIKTREKKPEETVARGSEPLLDQSQAGGAEKVEDCPPGIRFPGLQNFPAFFGGDPVARPQIFSHQSLQPQIVGREDLRSSQAAAQEIFRAPPPKTPQ